MVTVTQTGPSVMSMSATKSAIWSSDRRQAISALIAKHITIAASVSASVYAAYAPWEKPHPFSTAAYSGESCT